MRVFTTGETAKICHVSQQTIIRSFDNGTLKGFRVPGSTFRRIPESSLRTFMADNNIPLEWLDGKPAHVLLISTDEALTNFLAGKMKSISCTFVSATDTFDGGMKMQSSVPKVIIVDGLSNAATLRNRLRSDERFDGVTLIAITGQDQIGEAEEIEVFKKPFDPELLAQRIRTLTKEG